MVILEVTVDDDRAVPLPMGRVVAHGAAGSVSCRRDPHHDLLIFVLRGRITFLALLEAVDRALYLEVARDLVWNIADGDLSGFSLFQLESMIARVFGGPWVPQRWAIIGAPGASLAAAAVLAATAEEKGFSGRAQAFVDRGAAFEWLGYPETPTTPAAPDAELLRR